MYVKGSPGKGLLVPILGDDSLFCKPLVRMFHAQKKLENICFPCLVTYKARTG